MGCHPDHKIILWGAYNLGVRSTLVTWFHLTKYFKQETRDANTSQINLVTFVGYTYQGESPVAL